MPALFSIFFVEILTKYLCLFKLSSQLMLFVRHVNFFVLYTFAFSRVIQRTCVNDIIIEVEVMLAYHVKLGLYFIN